MMSTLPLKSDNWILSSSQPTTFTSTLPNFEESLPVRVNREGVKNYVKNRGTLNLGDWAIEGRRKLTSTIAQPVIIPEQNVFETSQPKLIGSDAIRNYIRSRSSTPNLIHGNLAPPDPHHQFRVKKEGRANYERNQHSQMKILMENYGKLPLPTQPAPHTQGEMATNLYHSHKQGHMGSILNNYGHVTPPSRPIPHVNGIAAEMNLQQSQGNPNLLKHGHGSRPSTPEPNINGLQANLNYDLAQGRAVNKLFHEYGKVPQATRTAPKVKYGGIDNFKKSQGDGMRKTISQCPPSNRYLERPQSVPL